MTRFKKRVSHAKEAFCIICIVIFLLIGLFTYLGPGGYLEMKKVQAELATHQARVDALQKSKQERLYAIDELRDDRKSNDAIERYLRKKGYGKKGELIQEVPQPEPDRTPAKGK
jgi:cell division protein FtsB